MPNARLIFVCVWGSSFSGDELETLTRTAKGGDAAGEIRRLEDSLKRLRKSFQEAKELATGSEEAAAKCQVDSKSNCSRLACSTIVEIKTAMLVIFYVVLECVMFDAVFVKVLIRLSKLHLCLWRTSRRSAARYTRPSRPFLAQSCTSSVTSVNALFCFLPTSSLVMRLTNNHRYRQPRIWWIRRSGRLLL